MSIFHNNALAGASGAAAGGAAAYQIQRSIRLNSADSAYLSRTPASAGNRKTWTWAGWVKRSTLGSGFLFNAGSAGTYFGFASDTFVFISPLSLGADTLATFRDTSAWYHIVVALDTTKATASERLKIYVNNVLQSTTVRSGYTSNYPVLNSDCEVNSAIDHSIGSIGAGNYFNGLLADVFFIDGQALTPSSFTETSATTGQLIPKAYTGTFTGNSFWLKFADNSAATATTLGKDSSGLGNNWTPNNLSVAELYSVYFDGSTNTSLSVPSGASISGTGDFTIEFWHKPVSFGSSYRIPYANDTAGGVSIGLNSSGTMFFGRSGLTIEGTTSNTVTFGQYNHFALTRSSGTFRMFINGTLGYTGTPSINYNSGNVRIGKDGLGNLEYVGEISALRSVAGTALYTSNFTAPARPLSQVSGTTLLACQTSALVDQSSNAYTITAVGNAHVFSNGDTIDSLVDTPSSAGTDTGLGGQVTGNYCTANPLDIVTGNGLVLANGNLDVTLANAETRGTIATPTSGKWYYEWTVTRLYNDGTGTFGVTAGYVKPGNTDFCGVVLMTADPYSISGIYKNGSRVQAVTGVAAGDVFAVALDLDGLSMQVYRNGATYGSAITVDLASYKPRFYGSGTNTSNGTTASLNFGQRQWAYAAPAGFKALCDTSLPAPTIARPSTVMDVKLYTGTGANQTVGGLEFSPDLVWVKSRSNGTTWHILADTVRGANNHLSTNVTQQETSDATGIGFASNGFTLGADVIDSYYGWNLNGNTYVGWAWDAGSSTVTNNSGSISSQVRANASAGFSVVSFTGAGGSQTVGHGLGVTPAMIIAKNRATTNSWAVWFTGFTANEYLVLNSTGAKASFSSQWGSTPTSTVFGVADSSVNGSGNGIIAYCFAPVAGYSSFGSYTGNGSADGPFVFCNFRPRWVMIKSSSNAYYWIIYDAARDAYNAASKELFPNDSLTETVVPRDIDFLSNGFKLRNTGSTDNQSGATYIYAAFAESPFAYSRAR